MTTAEVDTLAPNRTRVRHCDGPVGTYVGHVMRGQPWLLVDDGREVRQWAADDCEVVR